MDVLSVPESLNFDSIVKPSARPSVVSVDTVDLTESGDLEMTGHAYMFYLDYDDPELGLGLGVLEGSVSKESSTWIS